MLINLARSVSEIPFPQIRSFLILRTVYGLKLHGLCSFQSKMAFAKSSLQDSSNISKSDILYI